MRATVASYHAYKGVAPVPLQALMGWSDLATVQKYIRISETATTDALRQIYRGETHHTFTRKGMLDRSSLSSKIGSHLNRVGTIAVMTSSGPSSCTPRRTGRLATSFRFNRQTAAGNHLSLLNMSCLIIKSRSKLSDGRSDTSSNIVVKHIEKYAARYGKKEFMELVLLI